MEGDSDLIAVLIPANEAARRACVQLHSRGLCLSPDEDMITSAGQKIINYPDYYSYRIRLGFDNLPLSGILFGLDPECDIPLGTAEDTIVRSISRSHFRITYNERGNIILRDLSTWSTIVRFGRQCYEARRNFTWLLDGIPLDKYEDPIIHAPAEYGFKFKVIIASHNSCMLEYREKVRDFLKRRRAAIPYLDRLNFEVTPAVRGPSDGQTSRPNPLFYSPSKVLCGSFGEVRLFYDASTGIPYAKKTLMRHHPANIKAMCQEIRIMQQLKHKHIVPLKASAMGLNPTIIMPYYVLGNLHHQHTKRAITPNETRVLFQQTLLALEYLHGNGVTHRDLKPENILIERRTPTFIIRISDFGISKDGDDLITRLGSPPYVAPELFDGKYTPAVDLWSLGVVMMQYAHCLPEEKPDGIIMDEIKPWCNGIVNHMNHWSPSPLKLVVAGLLTIDPNERLSATECLEMGRSLPVSADYYGHQSEAEKASRIETNITDNSEQKTQQEAEPRNRLTKPHENNSLSTARKPAIEMDIAKIDRHSGLPLRPAMAFCYKFVENAVRQGLANDSADYFQLPFSDGNLRIRKKDHRLALSGALVNAGCDRHAIARLRGEKTRRRHGKSKKRSYHWNHITLETAMKYARKYDEREMWHVLQNFIETYRVQIQRQGEAPLHTQANTSKT